MNEITLKTIRHQECKILCGNKIIKKNLLPESYIKNRKIVIITDNRVFDFYKDFINKFDNIVIPEGEHEKNVFRIEALLERFIEIGIDRDSLIIGFGGGVICDITGFAASVYMRGCKFGFIASTLLAQVDAAIGGKNGVNLKSNKNFIGLINQPEFVIADTDLLKTLPEEEFKSGLAEIIKYALIADKDLFETIRLNKANILIKRCPDFMKLLVMKCINIKKEITEKDPEDSYLRHILNFGHTFGHAIEVENCIKHGMAILKGAKIASQISVERELLPKEEYNEIISLFDLYDYDTDVLITNKHFELIKNDKKKSNDYIKFVLLEKIGHSVIEKLSFEELKNITKRV